MAVGVAQIVVNTGNLDALRSSYLTRGWRESFRAERLPNHSAKVPFQAVARRTLDMAHLTFAARTSVEVTRYADQPPAGATVYSLDGAAVRLRACEPRASRAFWRALGFTHVEGEVFEARAPLPAWRLRVTLHPTDGDRPCTSVDADGCVLVTMLTTTVERELERLVATDLLLRRTPAWQEEVAGRTVTVAFVEGPSGELVELLQVPGGGR
jgi:catechol 2,3-dioxygenase-like lactoylglutathione lyase family enzyme